MTKSLKQIKFSIPNSSLWPGYFRNELSPFWPLFPATNLSRSSTPEMPPLRDRFYPEDSRELQMLISAVHGYPDAEILTLHLTWEPLPSLLFPHWKGCSAQELPTLRFGRKIKVREKPNPFLLPYSDACTDQRPQKQQQLTMGIIWCHKTLTLLFHCQMPNKTSYISFPCP